MFSLKNAKHFSVFANKAGEKCTACENRRFLHAGGNLFPRPQKTSGFCRHQKSTIFDSSATMKIENFARVKIIDFGCVLGCLQNHQKSLNFGA